MKKLFNKLPKKLRTFIIFVLILASATVILTLPLWVSMRVMLIGFVIFVIGVMLLAMWLIARDLTDEQDKT